MATKEMPPSTTVTPELADKFIVGDNSDSDRLKSVLGSAYKDLLINPLFFDPVTIAVDDATPDVSGGTVFITQANTGATAITDLDNPTTGQLVILIGGSSTNASTIADSGNFHLTGSMTLNEDDTIILYVKADNDYLELARSNN